MRRARFPRFLGRSASRVRMLHGSAAQVLPPLIEGVSAGANSRLRPRPRRERFTFAVRHGTLPVPKLSSREDFMTRGRLAWVWIIAVMVAVTSGCGGDDSETGTTPDAASDRRSDVVASDVRSDAIDARSDAPTDAPVSDAVVADTRPAP